MGLDLWRDPAKVRGMVDDWKVFTAGIFSLPLR